MHGARLRARSGFLKRVMALAFVPSSGKGCVWQYLLRYSNALRGCYCDILR